MCKARRRALALSLALALLLSNCLMVSASQIEDTTTVGTEETAQETEESKIEETEEETVKETEENVLLDEDAESETEAEDGIAVMSLEEKDETEETGATVSKTLTVDANGEVIEGQQYQTIQDAVDYIIAEVGEYSRTKNDDLHAANPKVYRPGAVNFKHSVNFTLMDEEYLTYIGGEEVTSSSSIPQNPERAGWTITVKEGTYEAFSISPDSVVKSGNNKYYMPGISNLTIVGEGDVTVEEAGTCIYTSAAIRNISFIDDDYNSGYDSSQDETGKSYGAYNNTFWGYYGGLVKINTGNREDFPVTLDGCYFQALNATAIEAYVFYNLTIKNCEFKNVGRIAINCNVDGVAPKNATLKVQDSTFTDCYFFMHGGFNNLSVTGNKITGREDAWSATLLTYCGAGTDTEQVVSGNTFTYADFSFQNALAYGISVKDYLELNTFNPGYTADETYDYSAYVDPYPSYPSTEKFTSVKYDIQYKRYNYTHYETTYYAPEKEGYTPVWGAQAYDSYDPYGAYKYDVFEEGVKEIINYLNGTTDGTVHTNDSVLSVIRKNGEGPQFSKGLDYHGLILSYEAIPEEEEPDNPVVPNEPTTTDTPSTNGTGSGTSMSSGNATTTVSSSAVKTGDTGNPAMWLTVLGIALIVVIGTLAVSRRRMRHGGRC